MLIGYVFFVSIIIIWFDWCNLVLKEVFLGEKIFFCLLKCINCIIIDENKIVLKFLGYNLWSRSNWF